MRRYHVAVARRADVIMAHRKVIARISEEGIKAWMLLRVNLCGAKLASPRSAHNIRLSLSVILKARYIVKIWRD